MYMKELLINNVKKIFLTLTILLTLTFCISSCETTTYVTSDDTYIDDSQYEVRSNIGFDIIIRYGTPYYYRGNILYYLYDGLYYYPYWYNDYWYIKVYSKPINHFRFRPNPYDYRFRPGVYRGYGRPHYRPNYHMNRPHSPRPHNGHMNRPPQHRPHNGNVNRPPHNRPNSGNHGNMSRPQQNHPHNSSPRMGGRR